MIKTAPGPRGAVCAHASWWDRAGSAPRHEKGHAALYETVVNSKEGEKAQPSIFCPTQQQEFKQKGLGRLATCTLAKQRERESSRIEQNYKGPGVSTLS